ncbi:hypothetical protein IKQ21_01475 [bacterium]|nr:hypothetical protein [bacterium]
MSNIFQKTLKWVYEKFSKDTSKMLIWTGSIGWALSSFAQMMGIVFNPKISDKEKSFLLPQEMWDAITNIMLFVCVTNVAKYGVKKLFTTGKFAPESVRNYIKKNSELAKQVGKIDFNLDKVAETMPNFPKTEYEAYRNIGTTLTTVGAGILATNILTPIARNRLASNAQTKYVNYKNSNPYQTTYYSNGMKI